MDLFSNKKNAIEPGGEFEKDSHLNFYVIVFIADFLLEMGNLSTFVKTTTAFQSQQDGSIKLGSSGYLLTL